MRFQNTMFSIHEATGKAACLQANAKKKEKKRNKNNTKHSKPGWAGQYTLVVSAIPE